MLHSSNTSPGTNARPPLSVTDQMVIFMLDNIGIGGGVTVDDLTMAGFSATEIGDYAHQAAKIARRRFVRQLEQVA
jgi:hypothetical protein